MSLDNKRFGIDNRAAEANSIRHRLESDPEFAFKLLDILYEQNRLQPLPSPQDIKPIEKFSLRHFAPFLTRKRDGRVFSELTHKICEETPSDRGCVISETTRALYRKLLRCFLDTASFYESYEDGKHQEIQCIRDEVRTIIMMRAISKLIKHTKTEKEGRIDVIEAGSGSGFLAAVAAVLDTAVRVVAYDVRKKVVECSKVRIDRLGLSNRVDIEERDLLDSPVHGQADCAIAEHISPGLLQEQTAEIPRSLTQADPDRFVPYSVKPYLALGMEVRNIVGGGVVIKPPFSSDSLRFFHGEEVVLADKSQNGVVFIDTKEAIPIPPRINHVLVGTDVRWLAPRFDDKNNFYESFKKRVQSGISMPTDISHVIAPTVIGAEKDRSCIVLDNVGQGIQETRLQLEYEIGVLYKSINSPIDIVSTNPAVEINAVGFVGE